MSVTDFIFNIVKGDFAALNYTIFDNYGISRIVAIALLPSKKYEDDKWAMNTFINLGFVIP